MAEIKELGESLLQRQKDRNDRQYEKSRREAYKIALATAGVGLVNKQLTTKATEFMASEPVLAQKAKYRAAVTQAANIAKMNEDIQASGQTAEEYFMSTRYLPRMEAEYKAKYGAEFVPESYTPLLREKAAELARAEAVGFEEALRVAQSVPDYDTAMAEINSVVVPPVNAGQALLRKVTGLFSGRTEDDFRKEAIQKVEERGLIVNDTVQRAFDKVSRLQGIDEAVQFVQRLDTSGFEKNDKVAVDTKVMPNPEGQGFTIIHVESVTDGDGNAKSQKVRHERIEGFETQEDKDTAARAVIDQANFPDLSRYMLSPKGTALFSRRLVQQGLNMTDIRTVQDFQTVSRVWADITSNPENLKDDVQVQAIAEIVSSGLGASENLLRDILTDDEKEGLSPQERLTNIVNTMQQALDASAIIGTSSVEELDITTPTTKYPGDPVDWNNL